jgi:23S rRNA (guanine745-N1)-methyltransferase
MNTNREVRSEKSERQRSLPLACSVRNCGLPLERRERAYLCRAGHSFDIAHSGYVNLLQPQDRRSPRAGDSRAAVDARAALDRAGIGRAVGDAVIDLIVGLGLAADAVVVDLGSGSGELLGRLCADRPIEGIGIDLSSAAVDGAARRFPALTWVVANADRRLPLQSSSIDVVLSIHGRRNPSECARVLTAEGVLIVALPAADDLVELRTFVQGQSIERHRGAVMLAEHRPVFSLAERSSVRESCELDRDGLLNLLRGTYRGARLATSDRVQSLERMTVTLCSEIFVLRPGGA